MYQIPECVLTFLCLVFSFYIVIKNVYYTTILNVWSAEL